MLTVKGSTKDLIDGMDAGADDFIAKPYEPSELAVRMNAGVRLLSAKEEVMQAEERYRLIFENMLDGYYQTDRDGNLVLINEYLAELLGFENLEDVQGRNIAEILYPDTQERAGFMHALEQSGGLFRDKKIRLEKKDGRMIIISANTRYCYDGADKVVGVEGVLRDITEQKRLEEERAKVAKKQLELINELTQANMELENFVRAASHDLKTPLRGIHLLAEWISTDYADKLDEEGKERLDLMMSRVKRMHRLLNGILRYSSAGHVEEKSEVNLNTLVSEVIDKIKPLIEDIDLEVVNELPTIICEKTPMKEVFRNLLSNAVRYMDKPEGKVTIGCTEEDWYWKFSVADNGEGIDERYYEKIFQFFQTLRPRDELESTGVGLPIVKKIVELQGGKIWVESKVGEGSTFFFTVPKATE